MGIELHNFVSDAHTPSNAVNVCFSVCAAVYAYKVSAALFRVHGGVCMHASSGGGRQQLHCESWRGKQGRVLDSHRHLCFPLTLPTAPLSGAHSMKDLPFSI